MDLRVNKCSVVMLIEGSRNLKRVDFEGVVSLHDDSFYREVVLRGTRSLVSFVSGKYRYSFRTE